MPLACFVPKRTREPRTTWAILLWHHRASLTKTAGLMPWKLAGKHTSWEKATTASKPWFHQRALKRGSWAYKRLANWSTECRPQRSSNLWKVAGSTCQLSLPKIQDRLSAVTFWSRGTHWTWSAILFSLHRRNIANAWWQRWFTWLPQHTIETPLRLPVRTAAKWLCSFWVINSSVYRSMSSSHRVELQWPRADEVGHFLRATCQHHLQ